MNEIFECYGKDPLTLCQDWLSEACEVEVNDPEAANLATVNGEGKPSNRMILIKEINAQGFKFHTNAESRKGQDIAETPYASLCFYWKSLRRQIRIEGTIAQVSAAESDDYFTTRSIERQIGAWASKQSQPFEKLAEMEAAVKKYEDEFSGADSIPRPPYWKGYRVNPLSIEFWIAHKDRLHTRFVYKRDENGEWGATWLCP